MFPLLCKLFSRETKFQALGSAFFQNPVPCIIAELDDMQRHNTLNYATLVLCMLNQNILSKDLLKDRKNEKSLDLKNDTLENCRLEQYTDTFKFMDALSAMEGTYTKQCGTQYTFVHDSMLEICAYQYGQQFPEQMLQYMNSSYIANYVKPQINETGMRETESDSQSSKGAASVNVSKGKHKQNGGSEGSVDRDMNRRTCDESNEREESFDLCIRLSDDQYPLLAQRLYRDIQNMELYDVFRNQVLKHPQVCQDFLRLLETKSYNEFKSIFLSSHGNLYMYKVVSIQEFLKKESEVRRVGAEWERREVLVDQKLHIERGCTTYNVRVISWVIYYGHHQILKYIMDKIQQHSEIIELYKKTEYTLYQSKQEIFTCSEQESEHIHNLSKPGISTYNEQESEELYRLLILGCYSGDSQTVRILLPVCKVIINRRDHSRYLPLTIACKEGHADIVKDLVKAGADVDRQEVLWPGTPLMAACANGHVNVVKKLLKFGADVNLFTPLIFACQEGHVSVVKELVKAGADVNLRSEWGCTPLIAAFLGDHASVVKELLQAGARFWCNHKNVSFIAATCSLSTIKCLVEYGEPSGWINQINKVDDIDLSPVYKALILNKLDVVKYLVQEQNRISPGKFIGNEHLFNCLLNIRCSGVKTDTKDDVIATDRSVKCWLIYGEGSLVSTIRQGNYDDLRRLLCLGLDPNQWIQLYNEAGATDAKPLLYALIDGNDTTEKVRILIESGADVNVRVKYTECESLLDNDGVSVLERTRQLCETENSLISERFQIPLCMVPVSKRNRAMCEIKKHIRRYSV
jgi:ankyrin repeat protein